MKILRVILQRLTSRCGQPGHERGQSMVEMALSFPLLLLILAATVEIGMYYNTYLTLVDATREAARYSANGSPIFGDVNNNCAETEDFYKKAACLTLQNLPGIAFNPGRDDIVVSVILIRRGQVYARYINTAMVQGEQGWSYCKNMLNGVGCKSTTSRFPNSVIQTRLDQFPNALTAPKSAYVLVEIYHVHRQFLGLVPPGLGFLPQEVVMHAYSIMPVPAIAGAIPD